MKVAIIQSNYIPWKGYFDIIHDVDRFVFYDDVQYTVRDWRNRNKIKGHDGEQWLTVPVGADSRDKTVREVTIADPGFAAKHWKAISYYYGKAPHFERYRAFFEDLYLGRRWESLSELNQTLITRIARELLGITTHFVDSASLDPQGKKQDRLIDVCQKVGATAYISGPAARDYIDPEGFTAAGLALYYKSYAGYPEYPQAHAPFNHGVSILDLLFQVGPQATDHIWGWRELERIVPAAGAAPAGLVSVTAGS